LKEESLSKHTFKASWITPSPALSTFLTQSQMKPSQKNSVPSYTATYLDSEGSPVTQTVLEEANPSPQ
jgi:hypothetical protein